MLTAGMRVLFPGVCCGDARIVSKSRLRPWAATLTADEARLLDDAGFTEDPEAYAEIAADATAHMASLYRLPIPPPRSEKDWASTIPACGSAASPARSGRSATEAPGYTRRFRFEIVDRGRGKPRRLKHVRGLDEVLPALLARELPPTAVAGFLMTPQQAVARWIRRARTRTDRDRRMGGDLTVDPMLPGPPPPHVLRSLGTTGTATRTDGALLPGASSRGQQDARQGST